ncbi:MAG: hypothetical protein ACPLRT_08025 [Thermoproteota archaeon]
MAVVKALAHRITSSMEWGSCDAPEPANEAGGVKPQLNVGSSVCKGGVVRSKRRI